MCRVWVLSVNDYVTLRVWLSDHYRSVFYDEVRPRLGEV